MIRINWPQIVNRIGSPIGEPVLFILPSAGRELLLSVAPRLLWKATYRTDGYDYDDFDQLTAIVSQTEYGLMNGVNVNDLISAIENGFSNLEDAISALDFSCPEPPAITLTCCNNADSLGIPDEPPEEIPTHSEPRPTTPEPGTETYLDYKCSAAHKYLDNVRYIIDNFMDLTLQQTPYQWVYDLMTTEEFGAPVFQALIAVLNFVVNNAYALLHDDTLEAFDAISEQLLCNIYTASTPEEAYQEMSDTIDSAETWFGIRYILNIIVVQMTDLTPLWVEDDVDITGYEDAICDCANTQLYGFHKLAGVLDPVLVPSGGTYQGTGWIGGTNYWECVDGGTLSYSGWPVGATVKVSWSFTTHATSPTDKAIGLVIGTTSGTRVEEVVELSQPGTTYSGDVFLGVNDTHFAGIANTVGLRLAAWSVYGLGE